MRRVYNPFKGTMRGQRWATLLRRYRSDANGTTAIEFGMVGLPFIMLLLGIVAISLYFVTEAMLDQALKVSRQIKTGASIKATQTIGQIREEICSNTAGFIDCTKLKLHIQSPTNWTSFVATSCVTNDALTVPAAQLSDKVCKWAGGSNAPVVLTACYPWDLWTKIPFIGTGDVNGGASKVIQSVYVFKSEPFSETSCN